MYGKHVHEAVIQNQEQQSGITIHLADELYDHGEVLFQASCTVEKNDTPDSLADKIHQLEHRYYATEIENYLEKQNPR
jgi:phosphoribosylglycinamide formyltransferase-1